MISKHPTHSPQWRSEIEAYISRCEGLIDACRRMKDESRERGDVGRMRFADNHLRRLNRNRGLAVAILADHPPIGNHVAVAA